MLRNVLVPSFKQHNVSFKSVLICLLIFLRDLSVGGRLISPAK